MMANNKSRCVSTDLHNIPTGRWKGKPGHMCWSYDLKMQSLWKPQGFYPPRCCSIIHCNDCPSLLIIFEDILGELRSLEKATENHVTHENANQSLYDDESESGLETKDIVTSPQQWNMISCGFAEKELLGHHPEK